MKELALYFHIFQKMFLQNLHVHSNYIINLFLLFFYHKKSILLISLFRIASELAEPVILTPDLRHEIKELKQLTSDFHLLREEGIHTIPDLESGIKKNSEEIKHLELQRSKVDNRRRRAKTEEDKEIAKKERKKLSKQLVPLRKKLKQEQQILEKVPRYYELLQKELIAEQKNKDRTKTRKR